MSMADIIGRIGTIESMIGQLSKPIQPAASTAASSAVSATAFESALSAATTTDTGSAGAGPGSLAGLSGLGGLPGLGNLAGVAGTGSSGPAGVAGPAPALAAAPAAPAAPVASGTATGPDVVAGAKKYIGVPYVWGGTNPATGMDCSGFVQRVFKDLGVDIPRVVSDQMKVGTPVASLADAKPGDLLVSFGGNHISIYLGNGKAIDAPVPGQTIQIRDAWEKQSDLTAIRRIVPAGQGAP